MCNPLKKMKIENSKIEKYSSVLLEPSRPPSRGGNTKALHMHIITISDKEFSFKALGTKQWIFKTDYVTFQYEINNTYNNIILDTLITIDKKGDTIKRGIREEKEKQRIVQSRPPASRKEIKN
ncbi:hypothetical protein [Tenacibaculum finnmarkense]|nr:hypothetical protein [Tenacibaculum finnmarkense]MCD8428489.1 hypothetical protein [Tenacibaculum finnmarkense genomovar finnmarkense]